MLCNTILHLFSMFSYGQFFEREMKTLSPRQEGQCIANKCPLALTETLGYL